MHLCDVKHVIYLFMALTILEKFWKINLRSMLTKPRKTL